MARGVDYAWARPNLGQLWSLGYRFVSRYLSWLPNGKVIGAAERDALLAQGFDIALNWEFDAKDALGGAGAGDKNGTEAVRQAKALGYPAGSTIYFSVDFDVTEAQQVTVNAYIAAAGKRCHGAGYRVGSYAGYWPTKRLFDAGLIDDAWQAYAWSGGQWDPRANLRQIQNGVTIAGADCDIDETVGPVHLWRHTAPAAPTTAEDIVYALQEDGNATVWLSTGGRRRPVSLMGTVTGLGQAGALLRPGTGSRVDSSGWVTIVPKGQLTEWGGPVDAPDTTGLAPHTHATTASTTGPAQPEAA